MHYLKHLEVSSNIRKSGSEKPVRKARCEKKFLLHVHEDQHARLH